MAFILLIFAALLSDVAAVRTTATFKTSPTSKAVIMLDTSNHWRSFVDHKQSANQIASVLSTFGVQIATASFNSAGGAHLLQGFSSYNGTVKTPDQSEYQGNAIWQDAMDLCHLALALQFGESGSNECPEGSKIISTAAECKEAATALHLEWKGVSIEEWSPKGCHEYGNGILKFNEHETGHNPASWRRSVCVGKGNSNAKKNMCILLTDNEALCQRQPPLPEICKSMPSFCPPDLHYFERAEDVNKCSAYVRDVMEPDNIQLIMGFVISDKLQQIRLQKASFRNFVRVATGCTIRANEETYTDTSGRIGSTVVYQQDEDCLRFVMDSDVDKVGKKMDASLSKLLA